MTYICSADSIAPEELLLEGKDAEEPVDYPPHDGKPALAPRPDLRGDKIDDRDAQLFQTLSDAKVKIGRIGQNGQRGPISFRGGDEFSVQVVNSGKMPHDLDQPDDGHILGPNDGIDASPPHPGTGTAEECGAGTSAGEVLNQ